MINGAHILLYSKDPAADRTFFKDVLGFRAVDAGEGWLIFALPPAEAGIHPVEGDAAKAHGGHQMMGAVLYLMCGDVRTTIQALTAKKVSCSEVTEEPWGLQAAIRLPSGGEIGLYEPRHPTAI